MSGKTCLHDALGTSELSVLMQELRSGSVNAEVASRCTAHVEWLGGFRYEIYADGHTFSFNESQRFPTLEAKLNPAPLLLASIGTSLSTRYVANAAARGVTIDALDIWVEGVTDIQTKDHVSDLQVKVYLKSDAAQDAIGELHAHAVQTSPFSKALRNRIDLTIEKVAPDWTGLAWCEPR